LVNAIQLKFVVIEFPVGIAYAGSKVKLDVVTDLTVSAAPVGPIGETIAVGILLNEF
jgi:hypothetical protein